MRQSEGVSRDEHHVLIWHMEVAAFQLHCGVEVQAPWVKERHGVTKQPRATTPMDDATVTVAGAGNMQITPAERLPAASDRHEPDAW